jgi:outer membrane immunogenic protein
MGESMKKILLGAVAAAAVTVFAAPAHAQPAGPRVEVIVGFDAIKGNTDDATGVNDDLSSENGFGGIRVGFDMPLGGAAIGIDLEATESLVDFEGVDGTSTAELRAGRDLYAGGRISLLASDAGNFYLTAGYTKLRLGASVTTGTTTVSDSTSLDGVRGGAGFQFNIGSNVFANVEYRYSNYEADVIRHQAALGFGLRF